MREAVGDDCAITARLCIDTLNDSPLGIRAGEEAYQFIQLADHLVDFWDLQVGGRATVAPSVCPNCGAPIARGELICTHCQTDVRSVVDTALLVSRVELY